MKTVIVACGAGVATSTIISDGVHKFLEENHIKHRLIQCSLREVKAYENEGDIIVTTMPLKETYKIPTVLGLSFITGMGIEETKNKIMSILNEEE